ncbi:MAG: hydrogenase maturation protease [Bacteroidetes bacterium]|jgi:hydrogenase maturation protease|nr:hydrogenase maturation protease [Bacteroidota bacterium]MBT5528191.1 hydrogenase maturation protease [Cytophagia bacterium]MBT3801699.1 hydrogenase maturation protease [Bacteroidota bacterium]MBT4337543.1 hydrogenase maturation protease [Bacteroidota bacterium]MBT4970298.1 hydrogenase maturation protease [Bacteroidota bacterium]
MGSDILTDDGVGVKIVDYLSSDPYFQNHHYHTELLFNLDMGKKLSEYNTVVFIDGTIQRTNPPGYIEINEITNFKETLHLTNIHEMKFQDCFTFWKNIGFEIPENVFVISIEVDVYLEFGSELSIKLRESFNEILNQVKQWVHHISLRENQVLV